MRILTLIISLLVSVMTLSSVSAQGTKFSHADWDRLLKSYVVSDASSQTYVDYARWHASKSDRAALDKYIEALASAKIDQMPDADKWASWINMYNAVTVDLILDNYPTKSIRRIKPHPLAIGPWKTEGVEIDGKFHSLHYIEHRILRDQWGDPRLHYAINCASYGCPNLMSDAWTGATLEAQLEQSSIDFINHPRGVRVDDDGRITLSKIFKWYKKDFGQNNEEIKAHILRYASPELAAKVKKGRIARHAYGWELNDVTAMSGETS